MVDLTSDRIVKRAERRFDQERVMDRGTNTNVLLGRQTTRQSQHFRPIGLHRKVSERPGVHLGTQVQRPTERGVEVAVKVRVVNCGV